jgi:hypothetical protein
VAQIEQDTAVDAAALVDLDPSVIRIPVGDSVVGWNCIISMSFSGTPTRSASAIPSPVHAYAFVVPV